MWPRKIFPLQLLATHSFKLRHKVNKCYSSQAMRALKSSLLSDIINTEIKEDNWINVRKAIVDVEISPSVLDFTIINYCCRIRDFKLGKNYLDFLENEGIKPNLATIGKYFHLFYLQNKDNMQVERENEILEMYNKLRKEYKILDPITSEYVAQALSLTKDWREAFKILDEIKVSATPNVETYSAVIAGAFRNSENELGWKVAKEMTEKEKLAHIEVYLSYLTQIKTQTDSKEMQKSKLEELFTFLKENDIKLGEREIQLITSDCKEMGFASAITVADKSGICKNCNKKLQQLLLTSSEFEELKTEFYKSAIIGKDVFQKTNPRELESFKNFLKTSQTYDVVIDGLNVAFSAGERQSPQMRSFLVASVVRHFVEQQKTVLVVGRSHIQRWPKKQWGYIVRNADVFLVESLSQDDPYLLYCALNSGNQTVIVTKDLMRGHAFRLKNIHHRGLFKRWLLQNQHQVLYVNNNGKVFLRYPLPYIQTAQKDGDFWHIPYESENTKLIRKERPTFIINTTEWACVKLN